MLMILTQQCIGVQCIIRIGYPVLWPSRQWGQCKATNPGTSQIGLTAFLELSCCASAPQLYMQSPLLMHFHVPGFSDFVVIIQGDLAKMCRLLDWIWGGKLELSITLTGDCFGNLQSEVMRIPNYAYFEKQYGQVFCVDVYSFTNNMMCMQQDM